LNAEEAITLLQSKSVSDRMEAGQWLLASRLAHIDQNAERLLRKAIASEEVPRVRVVLEESFRIRDLDKAHDITQHPQISHLAQESEAVKILQDLGSMLRHELLPVIGWVKYEANKEIVEFPVSKTSSMIEALTRRHAGLIALAEAHRLPQKERHSLSDLLVCCTPPSRPKSEISIDLPTVEDDWIYTDDGLFILIVSNAIQNAFEAAASFGGLVEPLVTIAVDVSDRDFWMAISNQFDGASFTFSNVAASGVSTKMDHRGLGTRVMLLAASRLKYEINLEANGGIATFTMRGTRGY
jgi:signal transduction histidine kinase